MKNEMEKKKTSRPISISKQTKKLTPLNNKLTETNILLKEVWNSKVL